jgi:hypothetical protein
MRRTVLLGCLLLLAMPATALAEWQFTPTIGMTVLGSTSLFNSSLAAGNVHLNLGGSVALLGGGIIGIEGVGLWTPHFFIDGSANPQLVQSGRALALMGNVLITLPRRWTEYALRPYVSGGFGFMRASESTVGDALSFSSNHPGFDIGGGAIGFLTARTGLRFDVRYFSTVNGLNQENSFGGLHLHYLTLSVGVVLRR